MNGLLDLLKRWHILGGLLAALFVAMGFGWRTPAAAFQEIHDQLAASDRLGISRDSVLESRVRRLEGADDDSRAVMLILLRIECKRSPDLVESQGVDCLSLPRVALPPSYRGVP